MSGESILIIDDSLEMTRHLSTQLLPAFGYETLEAANGQAGLEHMRREPPDLVLLDLNLPSMTGLDVLQVMAAEGIDIPVILMTGYGSEKSAIEAFRLGIKDYLVKPFTSEEVIHTIDRVLTSARSRHEGDRLAARHERARWETRRQLDDLNQVIGLSKSLLLLRRREEIMHRVFSEGANLFGAERCLIWLYHGEHKILKAYEHGESSLRVPEADTAENTSPVWQVFQSGEAYRDATFIGEGITLLPGLFARAAVLVSLRLDARIIGVLGMANQTAPKAFGDREQFVLASLADFVAIALENAQSAGKRGQRTESQSAEEFSALRSHIVANVSHDLRGPLHSIEGFASTLKLSGSLDEQQQLYVNYIIDSAQRLSRLVDKQLDPARIDAGMIEPRVPCDIQAIIAGVVQELRGMAQSRQIRLVRNNGPVLPTVWGSPDRLAQALRNLLDNAIKYSAPGTQVLIELRQEGDYVAVAIKDEGRGIEPDDLPYIFEQFYRARSSADIEGSGVGLALVRAIAEAYDGSVYAESEPGVGSTFTLKLVIAGEKRVMEYE
jgi:signal transduction histidine kinase/DNA-binding response OmpR family regulator